MTEEERKQRQREAFKRWYAKNKEVHRARVNRYRDKNPEKVANMAHNYYEKNKERIQKKNREWYENNTEKAKASSKKWIQLNETRHSEYKRKYAEENKERIALNSRNYRERNKDKIEARIKRYRAENPGHEELANKTFLLMRKSILGQVQDSKTLYGFHGFSSMELRKWAESQIDIPLSEYSKDYMLVLKKSMKQFSIKERGDSEFRKCFAFENMYFRKRVLKEGCVA